MHLIAPAPHAVSIQQPGTYPSKCSGTHSGSRAKRAAFLVALFAALAVAALAVTTRHADAASALTTSSAPTPAERTQNASTPPAASSVGYPVTIHVANSFLNVATSAITLDVTVDADPTKYELSGVTRGGILAPGDYPAASVPTRRKSEGWINRTYNLQFPDGKTGDFTLSGQWANDAN
jgi:hypothetical protein